MLELNMLAVSEVVHKLCFTVLFNRIQNEKKKLSQEII